ncbi:MAG: hypothetical protein ABI977_11405 [Acidobacteriota bacterium]
MSKKQSKIVNSPTIEEIAEQAEQGLDVSEHFTGQHVAKRRVDVDFTLRLLQAIDAECLLVGVTRQAWIKLACDERLRQIQLWRIAFHNADTEKVISV